MLKYFEFVFQVEKKLIGKVKSWIVNQKAGRVFSFFSVVLLNNH